MPRPIYRAERWLRYAERACAGFLILFLLTPVPLLIGAALAEVGRYERTALAVLSVSAAAALGLVWWLIVQARNRSW